MQSRKIGVLLGGMSSERDVSLRTAHAVLTALAERGHHAVPVPVDRDVDVALRRAEIDVAFVALRGRWGEDGCVQGVLELLGIPYTGSDVLASALAMHKVKAKELFRLHNLATPAYYTFAGPLPADELFAVHADFGFPCVVKPVRAGSSVGVSICHAPDELAPAVARALAFDDEILVERFIAGKEIAVAILGDRALGAVEIAPRDAVPGAVDTYVPPRVSPERYRGVLNQALRAHVALGCRGATRVDLMVSDTGNEFILEVNTVPGLTPTSLVPRIADAAGISFGELCELMVAGAALSGRPRHGEPRPALPGWLGADRGRPGARAARCEPL